MKRFKNILLVCDFNVQQQMAVERAVSLARQNEALLTVFSVIKELPMNARMAITSMSPQELLDEVINDRHAKTDAIAADIERQGIDVTTQVVTGTPFLEAIRQVLRDKHDLIILAAEGEGGFKERLFGSTSMHLMRKCPCPVWVIKTAKGSKYKRVLAAIDTTIDLSDPERKSLNPLIMQLASSVTQMDTSELHVVQVWSVFAEGYLNVRGQMDERSISKLRRLTKQEYSTQLDDLLAETDPKGGGIYRHLLRNDDAPEAIIKLAKNKKIDLLVMGTVCRTGLAGFFIGNTAEKVLSAVNCSVLTVKPEGFVTPVRLDDE